jgi:hypothetical protein
MKVLVLAMTIATVSLAAVTAASANIDSRPADTVKSIATGAVQAKPADMIFAQRRGRKCQENLAYGRTGSYGCG